MFNWGKRKEPTKVSKDVGVAVIRVTTTGGYKYNIALIGTVENRISGSRQFLTVYPEFTTVEELFQEYVNKASKGFVKVSSISFLNKSEVKSIKLVERKSMVLERTIS